MRSCENLIRNRSQTLDMYYFFNWWLNLQRQKEKQIFQSAWGQRCMHLHTSAHSYSTVHISERLWEGRSVAHSSVQSWVLTALPGMPSPVACHPSVCVHVFFVCEATHTDCDSDPKWRRVWLTSASAVDALSRHRTLREPCLPRLVGVIPLCIRSFPVWLRLSVMVVCVEGCLWGLFAD